MQRAKEAQTYYKSKSGMPTVSIELASHLLIPDLASGTATRLALAYSASYPNNAFSTSPLELSSPEE